MSSYKIIGIIVATTFMLTVLGLYYQLSFVLKRKQLSFLGQLNYERPTDILSLNQLSSMFLACYAFFLYGVCLNLANHYLAWPRFLGMLVLILLFYQIVVDRKNLISNIVFYAAIYMSLVGILVFLFGHQIQHITKYISQGLVVLGTIILAQGYTHQILIIRRYGKTGASSIKLHQLVLVTAISTVIFGFVIGLKNGWPLILLASVSTTLKLITLWCFRWVRVSKKAELLRQCYHQN